MYVEMYLSYLLIKTMGKKTKTEIPTYHLSFFHYKAPPVVASQLSHIF